MDKRKDADKYFETHPLKDKVFGTSDGFLFEDIRFAIAHAQTLDEAEREVETFANVNIIDTDFENVENKSVVAPKKVDTKPATAKKPTARKPAPKKTVDTKVVTPVVGPPADIKE